MSAAKIFAARAEACLREAAAATCLNERSRLIGEAAAWHMKAQDAPEPGPGAGRGLVFDDDLGDDAPL